MVQLGQVRHERARMRDRLKRGMVEFTPLDRIAEGVVVVAVRDVLRGDELARVVHQSVSLAASTINVHELGRQ